MFFFFKQKTAYEMRISDWSSDVCSSDLTPPASGTRSVRVDRTQPEEPSLAPYAHHPSSADRILALDSHLDEPVEGGAVDQRLQSAANLDIGRSEERREGKEGVRTCRSRWSPYD